MKEIDFSLLTTAEGGWYVLVSYLLFVCTFALSLRVNRYRRAKKGKDARPLYLFVRILLISLVAFLPDTLTLPENAGVLRFAFGTNLVNLVTLWFMLGWVILRLPFVLGYEKDDGLDVSKPVLAFMLSSFLTATNLGLCELMRGEFMFHTFSFLGFFFCAAIIFRYVMYMRTETRDGLSALFSKINVKPINN